MILWFHEPHLHDSLNNKPACKAVFHSNFVLDVSLALILGLKEWRSSHPWPIFSTQADAKLQFDTVPAGLHCHSEGLAAHLCPCPASWHSPGCQLSHCKTAMCCLQSSASLIRPRACKPSFCAAALQKTSGTPYLDRLSFYISLQCPLLFNSLQEASPGLSLPLHGKVFFPHPSSSCWSETLWNLLSY